MTQLETQVLESLRALSVDQQREVLDFVEFLLARAKRHGPDLEQQTVQPDPFAAAQQLRSSLQVQGDPLSVSVIHQRSEARY